MSENSQESFMETAYEKVKMFLYSLFLGLNYFSDSKNKKGSCKHGNVMKNVCLCIYKTKVWTILTSPLSEKKEDSKKEGNFLWRKKISDNL